MMSFDAPNREVCMARRATTNTPLQSLVLLNDPTYVEAARVLATHMMKEGGGAAEDRIRLGYRRCIARDPRADEMNILLKVLEDARVKFTANAKQASDFLSVGSSPIVPDLDPIELASWTLLASTLLNLDETISKK